MTPPRFPLFGLVVLLLPACLMTVRAAAPPAPNAAKHMASRPNLDMSMYRRSYTPDETATLRLSGYNVHAVQLTLYRLSLPALVPTSKALESFGKPIQAVSTMGLSMSAAWNYGLGKIYPDNWSEHEVKIPHVAPGVYLIVAHAGMVEKRTWYAVTPTALVAKRSRQELLVYAAGARAGTPEAGLPLTLTDAVGRKWHGATDATGVWRTNIAGAQGNLWVYGEQNGSPAFILSGPPPAPDPYIVYAFTDRPIYRPGQTVQYTGSIRQRQEAAAPGGFALRVFANQKAQIEVRDATDALISRRIVTTNAFGTFDGNLALATEPPLGRWQLIVSIGTFRSYASFEVQAYRKPEYTASIAFPAAHFLGGATIPVTISAQYFFGQPVAHAAVQYTISFAGQGQGDVEPNFTGQGITDAQGKLALQIKTQRHPIDRNVTISATVTDLSRRSQSASSSALITAGAFRLSIMTDKGVYKPGETVRVTAHAEDYDGKPVAAQSVQIQLIETKYDRKHQPYQEKTTKQVTTNAKGDAVAAFTPPRPGDLGIAAEAFDSENDKIEANGSIWVTGDNFADYNYSTLELVPDRPDYKLGTSATVLLNTNLVTPKNAPKPPKPAKGQPAPPPTYPDVWALVTLEGERLYQHEVVHLTGRSTTLHVPLTEADFPSVSLHVTILQERHIFEQQETLTVVREAQKLRVTVASDKTQLSPGQPATYTITTHDYQGHPIAAEVGLGVVDAAIYAISPDTTPDIESTFYSGQQVRLQTDFSFAAQYSGGAYQTIAAHAVAATPPGSPAIRVRRLFVDTAYWNPFVDTDANGVAHVSFTTPDNLTTWRATARGLTTDTRVGSATAETVSTMPLLVRLELPRFSVQGDDTVVSAIVHNYTGDTKTVQTSLKSSGVTLTTGAENQTLTLPAGGQQRLDWRVHIATPMVPSSPAPPELGAGGATFLVTADGGAGAQDAMELTLPTLPDGLKMAQSQADTLADAHATQTIKLTDLPPGSTVTLTLSPSLASAMFDALDYLQSYPYGCAEQTMSSFLPDIAAAGALKHLGVSHPVNPHLNQWVSLGLQKLYRYQHGDGGWNWWEGDQTDGDMTAYVLSGLIQARDAGYTVDDQRILRGTEALKRLLAQEKDPSRLADWLLTLSGADPKATAAPLAALDKQRDKLDIYGQASLALAFAKAGLLPQAQAVAHDLALRAVVHGTTVSWTAEEGGYSWREDDVDVTAHVLRALLTVQPQSDQIPGAIRWLMANRDGQAWHSTKTSAEVVFALAQYLAQTRELHPAYSARVTLDGQPVQTLTASDAAVFSAPTVVTLTPDQLRGHTTLTIDKLGAGVLYVTRTENYLIPPGQATPLSKGLAVRRTFLVPAEDPSHADSIDSGQEMTVTLDLTADSAYRYAMLEEPIPAGCEVASAGDDNGQPIASSDDGVLGYARQEVRDDKIVFFFDTLPKGVTHLTYRLHAETPGAFRILPSIASLVYFPEVRGNSGLAKTNIGEAK